MNQNRRHRRRRTPRRTWPQMEIYTLRKLQASVDQEMASQIFREA